ncbi:SBBP repeat-containing protein [Thermogutta sp.]|uniref:SBBP repeat-containing protein n=1 Tax=Thermogutta sp. TaxID=1962930 RepID=UPI00322022DA
MPRRAGRRCPGEKTLLSFAKYAFPRRSSTRWLGGRHFRSDCRSRPVQKELTLEFLESRLFLSANSLADLSSVSWNGSLGGTQYDEVRAAALDPHGNLILVGTSFSSGWVSDGYDTTWGGDGDAFVVKLSPEGTPLWSTYLGGTLDDGAAGVAVDADGNIYVAGWTRSTGWISGGYDTTYAGFGDGFVVKLSPTGGYLWGTYVGGSDWDAISAIALDGNGSIYVAGTTSSSGWVRGGFDSTYNGGAFDGFAAKLTTTGQFVWSTYLGGSQRDYALALAIAEGAIYVVGRTSSPDWMVAGEDLTYGGSYDGFLVRLSSTGQRVWSTYLGGSAEDAAVAVVASAGTVYVAGRTASTDWPGGTVLLEPQGNQDGFVLAVQSDGQTLWRTYLGGTSDDSAATITLRDDGTILVGGQTALADWVGGRILGSSSGGNEGFLLRLATTGQLLSSHALGGEADDSVVALVPTPNSGLHVVGNTYSTPRWPTTVLLGEPGDQDGFAAAISFSRPPVIAQLLADSAIVLRGESLVLRAQGVSDPNGLPTVQAVGLYLDANGNGDWDPSDTLLGETNVTAEGEAIWEIDATALSAWPLGRYRFFAIAQDDTHLTSDPVSTEILYTKRLDLGTVDLRRIVETEPGAEKIFYQLIPAHAAGLSVRIPAPEDPGAIRFSLYESDPLADPKLPPLAVSQVVDSTIQLEFSRVQPGTVYHLVLDVAPGYPTSEVLWTIANLVDRDPATGAITVFDTLDDDTVQVYFTGDAFNPGTVITLQGLSLDLPVTSEAGQTIAIQAGFGHDVLIVRDSIGDDQVEAWPDRVVFHRGGLDSPGSNIANPLTTIVGTGFAEIHIYGTQGGNDTARLSDSLWQNGADTAARMKFEPALGHVKWITAQSYLRIKFFELVDAFANGNNDRAVFFDGPGDEIFEGQWGLSRRVAAGYDVRAHGFPSVVAYSQVGVDRAKLIDSVLKDELQFKPHKTDLFDQLTGGTLYRVTVRGFALIEAEATSPLDRDKAALWDSVFDELITATPEQLIFARLLTEAPRPMLILRGFEFVKVRDSAGGQDQATVKTPLPYDLIFGAGWDVHTE